MDIFIKIAQKLPNDWLLLMTGQMRYWQDFGRLAVDFRENLLKFAKLCAIWPKILCQA